MKVTVVRVIHNAQHIQETPVAHHLIPLPLMPESQYTVHATVGSTVAVKGSSYLYEQYPACHAADHLRRAHVYSLPHH